MSVVVVLNHCKCDVCGEVKGKKEIRKWNDREVCTQCIHELMGLEVESDGKDPEIQNRT